MIEFTPNKEGLYVGQRCVPPNVYLDHWAWRRISESEPLANRFSSALKSRAGTLALSWLNLVEFSKLTDEQQASKADGLLDQILPQAFLINPDFFKVIGKEDQLQAGGEAVAPHGDLDTLRFFVKHNLSRPNSLKLFPAQNLFRLATAIGIAERNDNFADSLIAYIESLRRNYDDDRKFRQRVKRLPKGQPIQCGTRFIASELIGSLLVDKRVKIDRHHVIDISHAIVPVAYCEYVLLDAHWATQVERARKRIAEARMSFPMAKVFSERANGIERFLKELESGCTSPVQ
jgi:hypothetical protein